MIRNADAKWRGNSKCFLIFCLQSSSDEDIRISDSEEEQDDPESSGSFETVERRIVYSPKKKVQSEEPKPKTFYMGIQEAEILGTNEAFQPQLKLEDIYKNPERYTSMQLPRSTVLSDKNEALEFQSHNKNDFEETADC